MNKIHSLYIHIPFCTKICSYCDFPKLQFFRSFAESYLKSLSQELDEIDNKEVKTIYIGGGTPTSLDDDLFLELLKMVKPFTSKVEEFTVEANPESLSLTKLKMMKEYGVNRLSIGVQSTDDNILKVLNRDHTFNDVKEAVKLANEVGLVNYNVDLILGLPHVSKEMLLKDLRNIIALKPKHISTYSLTVHEHTRFGIDKVEEPDEDFAYDLYQTVHDFLLKEGFEHYEVSNFALPGYRSEHNLTYWRNQRYYGVGLAAASYIGDTRYKNTDNFQEYIKGNNQKEVETLSLKDKEEYQIMLNLRTVEGIDLENFTRIFNKDLYISKKDAIESYIRDGFLLLKEGKLVPTFKGMMLLDRIILDLI